MKRFNVLSLTAATAIAASGALAETPQATTETGTEVASEAPKAYDTNSPAVTNGTAEADASGIAISYDSMIALAGSKGEMLKTSEGTEIGIIEDVSYNAQGNPELVVDVMEKSVVGADRLVMTIQPGNIDVETRRIVLETTYNELLAKVKADGARGTADRVDVTIF